MLPIPQVWWAPAAHRLPGGGSDLDRSRAVRGRAVAELAFLVVAPTPQGGIAADGTRVGAATAGRLPGGRAHLNRCGPVGGAAVTELTEVVAPQHHNVSSLRIPHVWEPPPLLAFQVACPPEPGPSGRWWCRHRADLSSCCPSTTTCHRCGSRTCGSRLQVDRLPGGRADLNRGRPVGEGPVAEPAPTGWSPSTTACRCCGCHTSAQRQRRRSSRWRCRPGREPGAGAGAVADLAEGVVAPAPHGCRCCGSRRS